MLLCSRCRADHLVVGRELRQLARDPAYGAEMVSPYATCAYSWIKPPSRSRQRTSMPVSPAAGYARLAGGFCSSARCGRWTLQLRCGRQPAALGDDGRDADSREHASGAGRAGVRGAGNTAVNVLRGEEARDLQTESQLGALPTELQPHVESELVELTGLEPAASQLVRSSAMKPLGAPYCRPDLSFDPVTQRNILYRETNCRSSSAERTVARVASYRLPLDVTSKRQLGPDAVPSALDLGIGQNLLRLRNRSVPVPKTPVRSREPP